MLLLLISSTIVAGIVAVFVLALAEYKMTSEMKHIITYTNNRNSSTSKQRCIHDNDNNNVVVIVLVLVLGVIVIVIILVTF